MSPVSSKKRYLLLPTPESAEWPQIIIDTMRDGALVVDADARVIFLNDQMAATLGRAREELIGRSLLETVEPEQVSLTREMLERRRRGLSDQYEVRWSRPDGEIVWTLVSGTPLFDEGGSFRGAFALHTDITDRKQMELALGASEARFRSLAELSDDIVSLMTVPDDRKVYANPAYYRASGYSPEEIATTDWRQRIHPDDLPRLEAARQENLNGRSTRVEYRFRLKNGQWVWHENCAAPILDASSKVTHILCSSRDVTERHQKDEKLRASENEFRMLAEHLADVISLGDRSGRDAYISPAFERITGYTLEDLLAVPWQSRIHPEDVERLGAAREANWAGETNSVEYRYRTKDGRWIWFETRARPIRSSDGTIAKVLLSSRDITERKQAERALHESAERQRAVFSSLVEGVVLWNSSRHIAAANESAARLLGMSVESMIGASLEEVMKQFVGEDGTPLSLSTCPTNLTFNDLRVRQGAIIGIRFPDRSIRWLQITTQPMVMPGEREPHAVITTFSDISERRREEEARQVFTQRLIETQRLESLGLLAGRVAADFGDLLTGVGGYIELAQNRGDHDPELCNLLRQARTGVQRVSQLTEQLQAYAGKPLLVLKDLRIAEIVSEVIRLLRGMLSKRCVIEVDTAPNLPPLSGDAVQFRQLMLNLLLNAVEALAGREGRITVRARAEECSRGVFEDCVAGSTAVPGVYIVLEVVDNGPGMDSSVRAQIFEPYFTTKESGRGLGLAAVLGIVRGHRGAISVSSAPGSGALFRVYLPVQSAPEAGTPAAPSAAIRRILIVDDNATLRTVVSQMVRNLGYEVESAGNRQEAVRLLESPDRPVDLTLLDVSMPGGSLDESLRAIVQARPCVPVLLMSGYHDQPLTVRTDGLCMAGFLRKPFDICQLAEAVHVALSKAEANPQ